MKNRALKREYVSWVIIFLSLILRLPLLNSSFWLDEAAQILESVRPLSQQLDIIPDFQPPLLHLILHFVSGISSSEWWLRVVGALIFGLASIFLTMKLATVLKMPRIGLASGLLLATNSLHIIYSQELRPYALPTFLAVASWWYLSKAVLNSSKSLSVWLGLLVTTTLGLYSSYLYLFLILSQTVWVLICHRQFLKHYAVVTGISGLLFIPWIPTFMRQLQVGSLVRQSLPGWSAVVSLTQLKTIPLVFGKFVFGVMDLALAPYFITCLVIFCGLALLVIRQTWQQKLSVKKIVDQRFLLYVCWLIIPLLSAWIISFWIPIIQPKRVLFLLPAFYLLISWATTWIQTRWLHYTVIGMLLLCNIVGTFHYYQQPSLQRENWRALQQEITRKYSPDNSIVIFAFPEPFAPWRWYDQHTFPTLSLGYLVTGIPEDVANQLKSATNYHYVILFDYLTDLSDPQHLLMKEIESYGYQTIDIIDYPNIGFVRVYARPGVTVSQL